MSSTYLRARRSGRRAPRPKYLLPRAADAILMLVPPPTSEVDEASWGAFLNGEEGGN